MFDSRVGFSGSANQMDQLSVASNLSSQPQSWKNDDISEMVCAINFMFDSRYLLSP